jgi:hypothetical protein
MEVAEVRYVGIARWLGRAAWVTFVVGWFGVVFVPFAALASDDQPELPFWLIAAALAFPLSALLGLARLMVMDKHELGATTLSASDRGLHVTAPGRVMDLSRDALVQAALWPGGMVVSDRRGRELHVPMARADAVRLLDELELGAAVHRAVFRSRAGRRRLPPYLVGFIAGAVLIGLPIFIDTTFFCLAVFFGWVPFVTAAFVARWWTRVTITVGFDGVHATWAGRRVFAPFDSIAAIPSEARVLALALHDGRVVRIPCDVADQAFVEAVRDRVTLAKQATANLGQAPVLPVFAQRGTRSVAEWQRGVRAEVIAHAGYRISGSALDSSREVLQAPLASCERRVGAAMALSALGDDADRERIVRVAKACASARLGVALRAVAERGLAVRKVRAALAEAERAVSQCARQSRPASAVAPRPPA